MTSFVLAAMIASTPMVNHADSLSIALCQKWMAPRHDYESSGDTIDVNGALCFDGSIDSKSAAKFVQVLNNRRGQHKTFIVIRSVGGEVEAGLFMGLSILKYNATIQVQEICLSSCANYLLAAGRMRIVPRNALVAFHGGVRLASPKQVKNEISGQGNTISDLDSRQISIELKRDYRLQTWFLRRTHISHGFFDAMERFNKLPYGERSRRCLGYDNNTEFITFSPSFLAKRGYGMVHYQGPKSHRELEIVLEQDGWPKDFGCFMQ